MYELLGGMAEARDALQRDKTAEKDANICREQRKERIGKEMVARSLARKSSEDSEVEFVGDGEG